MLRARHPGRAVRTAVTARRAGLKGAPRTERSRARPGRGECPRWRGSGNPADGSRARSCTWARELMRLRCRYDSLRKRKAGRRTDIRATCAAGLRCFSSRGGAPGAGGGLGKLSWARSGPNSNTTKRQVDLVAREQPLLFEHQRQVVRSLGFSSGNHHDLLSELRYHRNLSRTMRPARNLSLRGAPRSKSLRIYTVARLPPACHESRRPALVDWINPARQQASVEAAVDVASNRR